MKRLFFSLSLLFPCLLFAQEKGTLTNPSDTLSVPTDTLSTATDTALDSLYRTLPEVMVTGERPVVKAEPGRLVYDLPRLIQDLPVDNVYDAVKELPGVSEADGGLQLTGQRVSVVLDGKVTTLSGEQLRALLQTMPASRIERAEVMYSAPARYQVRGALINIVLKRNSGDAPSWQGELYGKYAQKHYESFSERASLLYQRNRFSLDFLYSHGHGRHYSTTQKEARHTLSDGTVTPVTTDEVKRGRAHTHTFRLGADYRWSEKHLLSLVYNGRYNTSHSPVEVRGTQQSSVFSKSTDWLHNGRLDYSTPFGLTASAEMTWYRSPSKQRLSSRMQETSLDFLSHDGQRVNQWKFSLAQEHRLANRWGLNYGAVYTTGVDNSYQYYEDMSDPSDATASSSLPDDMRSRRREETLNLYAGVSKAFSDRLSFDASVAAERYKTSVWDRWDIYPVVNLSYRPSSAHILQLSVSSDKRYPDYWALQEAVSYLGGGYSEIHGNPSLLPSRSYETQLAWIVKGKYVFVGWFNHVKDYNVQTLWQSSERLVEVYKYLNFDYQRQGGLQASLPWKAGKVWDARLTLIGIWIHEKDSDFWDEPFDRSVCYGIARLNNTFTLSSRPDLRLTLSGMVHSKAIQGTYDLPAAGYVNLGLRYAFAGGKAVVNLWCNDLFETSQISPRIRYRTQWVTNRYSCFREWGVSFTYRFGGYREKQRKEVDTSRFK